MKTTSIPVLSTGSLAIDELTGVGGFPMGRIVQMWGPESSGKSTVALHLAASAQAAGHRVVFVDADNSFNVELARIIGVDLDSLTVITPTDGNQGISAMMRALEKDPPGVMIVDSLAGLNPDDGGSRKDPLARAMRTPLQYAAKLIMNKPTLLFFTNQMYHQEGVMFGSPERPLGGMTARYIPTFTVDIRRIGTHKADGNAIGSRTRVKLVKSRLSTPFREATFEIRYGVGIYRPGEVLEYGVSQGLIQQSGSRYRVNGELLGNGRGEALRALESSPDRLQRLFDQIREGFAWTAPQQIYSAPAPQPSPAQPAAATAAAAEPVTLRGASLVNAGLDNARLQGVDLREADLERASLIEASLIGANLSKAFLIQANLSSADLSGADLSGTNLEGAVLHGTILIGATFTEETIWPDGFDPTRVGATKA